MPTLLFDCDGVLADTERFGHLPAFNQTFAEAGIPVQWSDSDYAEKVLIGGGKERMASIFTADFVAIYTELVEAGAMPARPGIDRLVGEAIAAGFTLAVASTSAEQSVRAVLTHAVGSTRASAFRVFAGDIVDAKKPAPDIYLLALAELGVEANDAVVIEDSANGLRAALGAGLRTIVTVSSYTREEDFAGAALVVGSLGDPNDHSEILAAAAGITPSEYVRIDDVVALLTTPPPTLENT